MVAEGSACIVYTNPLFIFLMLRLQGHKADLHHVVDGLYAHASSEEEVRI